VASPRPNVRTVVFAGQCKTCLSVALGIVAFFRRVEPVDFIAFPNADAGPRLPRIAGFPGLCTVGDIVPDGATLGATLDNLPHSAHTASACWASMCAARTTSRVPHSPGASARWLRSTT
jgi:hypothetical protein